MYISLGYVHNDMITHTRSEAMSKSTANYRIFVLLKCIMLTNVLEPRFVFRGQELYTAFNSAGMTARVTEYNTAEQVNQLLNDPRVRAFFEMFSTANRELFVRHRDQQILCIGIILLTIGKSVNPDNYEGWINNRLRTFQGALGILPDYCCWAQSQCPIQEVLACSYSFLSACFDLRKLFFSNLHICCKRYS